MLFEAASLLRSYSLFCIFFNVFRRKRSIIFCLYFRRHTTHTIQYKKNCNAHDVCQFAELEARVCRVLVAHGRVKKQQQN